MHDPFKRLRLHIEQTVALTDEEFEGICTHFTFKKFKKHQFLIQEDEAVKYCYFIVSGLLKLVFTEKSAKQHIVSFAMDNWWESDFQAYFTKSKATLSLECIEPTEVLCLSIDHYEKLCASQPKVEHFILKMAHFGNIASQQRIISLLTSSAEERYAQWIKMYPQLVNRIPKTLLAAYLGVSRETLSRIVNF